MNCELTIKKSVTGNKVAITRNNVSGRTKRKFHPNLQKTFFSTKELGNFKIKIATSTKRSIDKYGGLINYLLYISENQLSSYGISLKKKILKFQKKINKN